MELMDNAEHSSRETEETLIAVLGHDLRNPLHAALACNELLQRKLTEPGSSALNARVKSHLRRMSALIEDVLDFASGRRGEGIWVELSEVQNVSSGLTQVIQELEDAHAGCQIISIIHIDHPVRCDLVRLQQLTSNLLANALTHGRPTIPVELTAYADQEHLILQVWNAGEPIPEEDIERIFEPFWRPAASARRSGLGLGLYICAEIVRAHAGSLTVESTAALGTQFTARLPLGPPVTLPDAAPVPAEILAHDSRTAMRPIECASR
jgi:signal transduction histidine kinase